MRLPEVFSFIIIGLILVATFIVSHERAIESDSLSALVRAEVKAEMDLRYRNVPRIQVEKVYTLHATGQDIVIETEIPNQGG